MRKPGQKTKAFTLLELVIVLAVAIVLTAALTATFSQASDQVRQITCQNYMGQVGVAMNGFAQTHEGRFPGGALGTRPDGSTVGTNWVGLLNYEFFHPGPQMPSSGGPILFYLPWSATFLDTRIYVTCPSIRAWNSAPSYTNMYARPWMMNRDAAGGPNWGGYGIQGPYGKLVPLPQPFDPMFSVYYLGARQDFFASPSYKFLVQETEYANDLVYAAWPYRPETVKLNANPARPPWASDPPPWAFRHNLGPDARLYQGRARAPALFIDTHVEVIHPTDSINTLARFAPTP